MPSLPYLYGLIKIHKENIPLMPIVSTTGSVTYKLSKFLVSKSKQLNGQISSSFILNSEDFVDIIRDMDLENKIMVSFDVKSLFTNVPLDQTLNFSKGHSNDNPIDLPFNNSVLIDFIKLCVDNCYFTCNGQFFRQIRGLPMGSCLSPDNGKLCFPSFKLHFYGIFLEIIITNCIEF